MRRFVGQEWLAAFEQLGLILSLIFLLLFLDEIVQERDRPLSIKELLGRPLISGLDTVAALSIIKVDRKTRSSAATFLGGLLFMLAGEKSLEDRQQERAELAALVCKKSRSSSLEKNSCVRSLASSAECPRRRAKA